MSVIAFCPLCRATLKGLEPTEVGYSRLEVTCYFCKHHIMIHDFGRQ